MAGLAAARMSGGSEFHAAGPACEKERSPNLVCSRGVTYLLLEADRRPVRVASELVSTTYISNDGINQLQRFSDLTARSATHNTQMPTFKRSYVYKNVNVKYKDIKSAQKMQADNQLIQTNVWRCYD